MVEMLTTTHSHGEHQRNVDAPETTSFSTEVFADALGACDAACDDEVRSVVEEACSVPSGQSHACSTPLFTHTFTLCPLDLQILEHAK